MQSPNIRYTISVLYRPKDKYSDIDRLLVSNMKGAWQVRKRKHAKDAEEKEAKRRKLSLKEAVESKAAAKRTSQKLASQCLSNYQAQQKKRAYDKRLLALVASRGERRQLQMLFESSASEVLSSINTIFLFPF